MLLSKVAVASILALASSIAAQVVVTVTSTVTIITVTVTPPTTSTSTAYVTVSAAPPRTSSSSDDWWEGWNTWRNRPTLSSNKVTTYTSTAVVTVTVPATTAPITTCPLPVYNQCGGRNWEGCTYCTSTASCKSSNEWYYQCLPKTPKVITVTSTIFR